MTDWSTIIHQLCNEIKLKYGSKIELTRLLVSPSIYNDLIQSRTADRRLKITDNLGKCKFVYLIGGNVIPIVARPCVGLVLEHSRGEYGSCDSCGARREHIDKCQYCGASNA